MGLDIKIYMMECQMENDKQNIDDNIDVCSLSSDDSEIIISDDINVNHIPGISDKCGFNDDDSVKNSNYINNPKYLRQIVDKSEGLKKVLFRNHFMEPLTFLLLLHDFGLEIKLSKLIEDCGGLVYGAVNNIDGFTAVLVKDESFHWSYTGPVFKVSYITACFEAKKIINISPFFKGSVRTKFTKDFDYMSVIYFKKNTWDEIPNMPGASIAKIYNKSVNESKSFRNVNSSDSDDDDVPLSVDKTKNKCVEVKKFTNKHSRFLYSIKEDEDIVKYIVKKKAYDNVRGVMLWKQMEMRDVCPHRTWQSMKEHFRKKIVFNLDSYKFLTEKEKHLLQGVCL